MLSPNTILRERYRIIHQLGHGGMGAVYQAMDENLSCVVAVKETFATTDEQRRAFRREAELLANLTHPTLPRVMDHFTQGKGQFLVMQFVPGHDLAELLELREQPFAVAKVLDWADQILDALEELHSSNPPVIHRDIKPSNLKVTPRGRILLLDFGLAKGFAGQMSTADADSHGKSIYGYTPNYAPIEQVRGAGTDPRSDLYSLAATLWTLLTARVPPDAVTRMAEIGEGNDDPLIAAHQINSQIPASVSSALNRALTVNRNQRFDSAVELRQALHAIRDLEVEHETLQKNAREHSLPSALPATPPLGSTVITPEPSPLPPATALGSTIGSPQPDLRKPAATDRSVETMRVASPPNVPSFDGRSVAVTAASIPPQEDKPKTSPKILALVVATVLIIGAIGIALAVWRPWVPSLQSTKNSSATTDDSGSTGIAANRTAPDDMVYVPGGTFTMGRDTGDAAERPSHHVAVAPFFIDKASVTRQDYNKFNRSALPTSHKAFFGNTVTGVTWDLAKRYCEWAGKRLPTEEEWEFAARGTDNRIYPWGNDWQYRPQGNVSPFGIFAMVGNGWQWTASDFVAYPGGQLPGDLPIGPLKVIRGGNFDSDQNQATTTYRRGYPGSGNYDYSNTTFRCVKDVK